MSKYSEIQEIVQKAKLNHKALTKEFYDFIDKNKIKVFKGTEKKGYTTTGEYLTWACVFTGNIMDSIELDLIFKVHEATYKYLPRKKKHGNTK